MTRARGKSTRYAPSVAAIAPDAPIVGTVDVGSMATCDRPASAAADQVEDQEPEPPEAVLDVVPEDPQVEHVAEQVQPAAVEELARHERRRLARQVVAVPPGRGQVGRDDAPFA